MLRELELERRQARQMMNEFSPFNSKRKSQHLVKIHDEQGKRTITTRTEHKSSLEFSKMKRWKRIRKLKRESNRPNEVRKQRKQREAKGEERLLFL